MNIMKSRSTLPSGYTMIEIVVMMAILTTISAIALYGFTGFSESGALNRGARELALAIRRSQNMALAVSQIDFGGTGEVPAAVGVQFSQSSPYYFLFGDRLATRDNKYTDSTEKIGTDEILPRGVRISALTGFNPSPVSYATVHILFEPPEANVVLSDNGSPALSIGNRLEVELQSPSGNKKTISVRESGEISIR